MRRSLLLFALAFAVAYACAVARTPAPQGTPAAPAPATAPASPAPASATPPKPITPPVQAREVTAPLPIEPEFEDPTKLPIPGAPFGRENKDGDVVLKEFPKDAVGSDDWVKMVKENMIKPHESLDLTKPLVPPFNFDIEIPAIGAMPNVIFPHFPHTFWLDCGNCHPGIFIMKKGANPISMVKIVNGEFCGRCHGRVAFPIANCTRCHVKPKG